MCACNPKENIVCAYHQRAYRSESALATDTRTPAMKAADLEQQQVRIQLKDYREELKREGCDEVTILCGCIDDLEDRLVRLYCAHYELLDGVTD